MKTIILSMCVGAILWQLVTTIVLLVTEQNAEKTVYCGCGVWTGFLAFIGFCYRSIRLVVFRKRYDLYSFNSPYAKHHQLVYMTATTASFFRQYEIYGDKYTIKFLKPGSAIKYMPSKCDILKNLNNPPSGMSRDYFNKFLKSPLDKD